MAGSRYIADPPDRSRRVELEGLTILYHRPSGMTHILAPPAPQILAALADQACDINELTERLSGEFELQGGVEALRARVAELEASGLVRPA